MHKQTYVEEIDGNIDTLILPLIKKIWAAGGITYSSCIGQFLEYNLATEADFTDVEYYPWVVIDKESFYVAECILKDNIFEIIDNTDTLLIKIDPEYFIRQSI